MCIMFFHYAIMQISNKLIIRERNGRHIAAFAASKYMYDRLTDIVHRQVLLHLNHVTSVNNIEKT